MKASARPNARFTSGASACQRPQPGREKPQAKAPDLRDTFSRFIGALARLEAGRNRSAGGGESCR